VQAYWRFCLVYIVSKSRMIMNDSLERMWKRAVMVYFKVLLQYLPGETEENHRMFHSG
jgi:hypothetical protein